MTLKVDKLVGLNITVDHSSKGHLEVTGEGFEYTWENVRLTLATNKGAHLSCDKIQHFSVR
eukprot:4648994-Ditylum_brightwellii.AAC.1